MEPRNITEKKLNNETNRIVGEIQLHQYGLYFEKYNNSIDNFKKKIENNLRVRYAPISIQVKAHENCSLLDLVHSDNKVLGRILISLASVCNEITLLVDEVRNDFCLTFLFYGEDTKNKNELLNTITELIGKFERVIFLLNRACQVVILLIKQMCALLGKHFLSGNSTTCFPEPLDCLAELLVSLLLLENVLISSTIKENWVYYKKAVRSMLHNPSQFEISAVNLRCLYKRICDIDNELLTGKILQNTLQKCMQEKLILAVKNCSFATEVSVFLQQLLTELEKDDENISFTQLLLQANVLFVFHHYLFCTLDKKNLKRLLDVNKKAAACTLIGNIVWYPEEFLLKHIPSLAKTVDLHQWIQSRHAQVTVKTQNLAKECHSLSILVCIWMIEIRRLLKKDLSKLKTEELYESCYLLIDGIKLIKKIGELIKWITNLHASEGRPMTKSVLLNICKLIEVLKGFQFTCKHGLVQLTYVILLNLQVLTHKGLGLLGQIKKNITQEKSYKEEQLDVLSALAVAETSFKGAHTAQRLLVTKLALSASGLNSNTLFEIRSVINRIELICNIYDLLNNLCSCTFLYWHQALLPICFQKLVDPKHDLATYYIILAAVSDCNSVTKERFFRETEECLNNSLISQLNQIIETNLRLQTHLHLQLPPNNPFENLPPENFQKVFPANLGDLYISIKQNVEHYLSTMFYNLTTVVLHDWKTYGEMRRLAWLQYGLTTVEDNLPMQTLEQGLDVLEITRNIHIFVSKYLYNLNNQIFVEEWSNNKHLNTINISHVANSIRTHGIGIMSTTVNYTYQFLKNQFFTFSQFMFDEYIKSKLLKDSRFFNEHKNELNQMYPYEKAEKFNLGIRKLGLHESGLSYLDLFRKLITQIGNAMGYIRLIRSGGRRCLADGTCFIKDFNAVDNLNMLINEINVPALTEKAADCLRRDMSNLINNFQEATEYFQLLLNVFSAEFKDSKYMHLKNFYLIIPPLTINFVEHCLTCKEKLNKKNREGAAFTDDGFAMGLACIIDLLEQSSQFNSLHWFQSVRAKNLEDIKKLDNQKSVASRDDEKLQQTLSLTERRIKSFNREFQLLYYNINSAKIFFQT